MCIRCHGNTSTTTASDLLYNQYIHYFLVRNYLVTIYNTDCMCDGSNMREYVSTSMPYYSRFPNDNLLRGNTTQDSWNLSICILRIIKRYKKNITHLNLHRGYTRSLLMQIGTPWQLKITAPQAATTALLVAGVALWHAPGGRF